MDNKIVWVLSEWSKKCARHPLLGNKQIQATRGLERPRLALCPLHINSQLAMWLATIPGLTDIRPMENDIFTGVNRKVGVEPHRLPTWLQAGERKFQG